MTFDINKHRKFGHWVELAAHVFKLRLWKFFLNNFSLSRNVSSLKIGIFLLSFIWSCVKQVVISLPLKQIRRMSELSGFVYIKSYGALHVNSKAQKVNYSMMRYLVSEPWWNLPASKNCIKLTALRQWLNKPSRKKFKTIDEFSEFPIVFYYKYNAHPHKQWPFLMLIRQTRLQ